MVNVTSHLPFNLHNKKPRFSSLSAVDVSTSTSTSFSSLSLSASASTLRSAKNLKLNRRSLNFTPSASYNAGTAGNLQVRVYAPLMSGSGSGAIVAPVPGHGAGAGEPSRSSSPTSRETSLHDRDEERERWGRWMPVLNVCLVQNVLFIPTAVAAGKKTQVVGKEAEGAWSRRGRARGRTSVWMWLTKLELELELMPQRKLKEKPKRSRGPAILIQPPLHVRRHHDLPILCH
ncbi:hypothetical protein CVT25_003835 [Psilocybe cyanescens]|uniref:Uncharacterized protein n=1 Tax=Psilocybe cyanescens TaxID=93625 RepID=A0A409XQ11_PSICY|nr:hypothetical protein CVT25_003835 [Psilocybe cyanescens]